MVCNRCEKLFRDCVCEDLEQRLESVSLKGTFVFKVCERCAKHYERCKCLAPSFVVVGKALLSHKVVHGMRVVERLPIPKGVI